MCASLAVFQILVMVTQTDALARIGPTAPTCVDVNGQMTATEAGRRNKAVKGISLYVRL